jgi:hypothetical protein
MRIHVRITQLKEKIKLHKKLAAVLTIAIFAISTFAIVNPVSAHFTLGDLTPTYRYHANDFDPHVPGVIGYVWPGGGQNAYGGFPNFASVNNAPGYQSPYPGQKPANVAGVNLFGNAPSSSWYQLEGDTYAPFGAVLTDSTGDLIFAINATALTTNVPGAMGPRFTGAWDWLGIMIPPGFIVPDASQVVTTLTNDYSNILVMTASPYDRYAPGWTVVYIASDSGQSANPDAGQTVYYNHQRIQFTSLGEWYYVRINGVSAPSVAGRYFFKILLGNGCDGYLGGPEGTNPLVAYTDDACGQSPTQFLPTQNWPVMLVKGEIDPAIITGTIRYAGYNQTLYSHPIQEAGRVEAVMTTRLDPYTGQQRPDLPLVSAVGYFNATAHGHYEVEGLAPGVYDLYASAAGYPKMLVQSGFTVLKGQSLHFDGYLQPGPVIHGNVFTKHQFGDQPWPTSTNDGLCPFRFGSNCLQDANPNSAVAAQFGQYMKIELYDAPTLNHVPDSSAKLVSWSPVPCIAGGQEYFYARRDAGYCNDPRLGSNVAFPWHEYVPTAGYGVPTPALAPTSGYYQVAAGGELGTGTYFTNNMQDPQGVGPPQHWYVQGGTTQPFHFEFGVKGEYGAPKDLDGMVPQVYATWVNGLTPGRYYARAWTFRYVQSALDGSTFQEYYFDVTPNEWAGDVTLPIDLRLSSWINKTVHFHNVINGITTDPIDTGAGLISGVLVDSNGQVWSYNQSLLGYQGFYSWGSASGWQADAFNDASTLRHENDLDKAKLNQFAIEQGRANIQFWGWNDTWGGENYGIPSGTYQPHVFVLGYIENSPESVSVSLSGNPTSISDHMYRGAGFNLTVYSIDWERPRVSRNWVWGQWGIGPTVGIPSGNVRSGQMPYSWGAGYTMTGLGTAPPFSTTPGLGKWATMVGQEIDIGFYNNGTLVSLYGDNGGVSSFFGADTTPTTCLFQNDTTSSVQMCGGGWNPDRYDPATGLYVVNDGNSNDAFFGLELYRVGFVGGYTSSHDMSWTLGAETLFAPAQYSPTPVPGTPNAVYFKGANNLYPTALPVNQQYDLRAYTYGYVQDKAYSAWAASGQVADMKINLIIGANVTLDILFKKEHIITPTDGNMSARVRLFDDSGRLVAEWMSSEGTYVTSNGQARAADGTTQYPFGNQGEPFPNAGLYPTTGGVGGAIPFPNPLNTYNYLPGGVTLLHVLMAGLPVVPPAGQNAGPTGGYENKETYFMDPVLAPWCDFSIGCYANPGPNWDAPGYFPNYGILGAPDYQGGWTAEVDFVRLYANNTGTQELLSNGLQCNSVTDPSICPTGSKLGPFAQYYPPVAGLLMGESYHIIPGTTATSGISLTEDLATNTAWNSAGWSVGHSMAPNHLGPYSQQGVWQIANTHLSGEASAIFEVDLNGLVTGNALAFSWSNEFRPLSWGLVNVVGAQGGAGWNFYTFDGVYEAYLPPGTYQFTISGPGYATQSWSVAVSSGQTGTGQNLYLEQSNIPVPEFSGLAIAAVSALAASLYVLRRRRK